MMKTAEPYASNLDYLSATLEYLTALAGFRRAEQGEQPPPGRREGRRKAAAMDLAEDHGGNAPPPAVAGTRTRQLRTRAQRLGRALERRTRATIKKGTVDLPLEKLCAAHGLDRFEKLVLALLLGSDMDTGLLDALESLSPFRRGTHEIRTVLTLLCESTEERIRARRYFVHDSPLLANGLVNLAYTRDISSETEFMSMDLALPRRIASLLLDADDADDAVMAFSSVIEPEVSLDQVVLPPERLEEVLTVVRDRDRYIQARQSWGFDRILSYGRGTVIMFSGPPGTGKTMLAHALAKESSSRLMLADARQVLQHSRHDFAENLQRMFHEARILHAVLFFDEADELFTDRSVNGFMPTLLRELEKLDGICILATNRPQILDEALERRILYRFDFELPTPELREQIWRKHLPPEARLAPDVDCKALADEFEFSGGFIKNAVLAALTRALQRPEPTARQIKQDDLRQSARQQVRNRLRAHSDRMIPRACMDDLILDTIHKRHVNDVVSAARHRQRVMTTWGFGELSAAGRGITALFSGPPGSGKSLAAEVIAHELGYGLRSVPVSSLLSAYVGETEKRIAALFADVRDDGTVLLMDEADALFGARIARADHHAHYINHQVNVLLRELERHDGLVILTTNRPQDFDPAFMRRIRFHIEFPAPGAKERALIWRRLIPRQAPLADDVDFDMLGDSLKLTGGHIRNAILRAAFVAAADGGVLTQALLHTEASKEAPARESPGIGFARAS